MKRPTSLLLTLLLLFVAACGSTTAPPAAPPPEAGPTAKPTLNPAYVQVSILHTNDIHGFVEPEKFKGAQGKEIEIGGLANLVGLVDQFRKETSGNVIVLDAGDLWRGTFMSNQTKGELVSAALNIAGYDAVAPGNHDFDDGQEVLQARVNQAKFPWLAANLIETATGQPPLGMKAYLIKTVAGIRFGIIGLTNPGTPIISKPSSVKGLQFLGAAEGVRRVYAEVKRQSDVIVVLSHVGIEGDEQLAQEVPDIDVIIGGHSHTELQNARLINNTVITQAGSHAKFLGKLDLTIDRATKKIVEIRRLQELENVNNARVQPNAQAAALVKLRLDETREIVSRPIGETLTDLTRAFTTDGRTTGEYPLGNLVVDAMLAANQAGDRPADIALHNNAGLRTDIPKGQITYGKLYEVLPFDNVMTALDLNGAQIKQILEVATSCPRVNILVAGLSFVFDCAQPRDQRVSNVLIQGKPLDPKKTYRVQTMDYFAGGGDGQVTFREGTNLVYGDVIVDVTAAYVKAHSPLNIQIEGRIKAK
ncbi:MAG: bifunctional metallophosphatase/5'-nucleotidase [Chloroflexi bacterium]|nr:bifunctional metallophosphatase/5'-nucleotidase [Chloroflexota bacterium]